MNKYLDISKEVKSALSAGKPVVALDSRDALSAERRDRARS